MDRLWGSEGPIWGSGCRAQNGPICFFKKGAQNLHPRQGHMGAAVVARFSTTIPLPPVPTGSIWTLRIPYGKNEVVGRWYGRF